MTVRFDGEKYSVTLKTFINIEKLKLKALCIRIHGWCKLLKVSDLMLICLLLFLWAIAGLLFSIIDNRTIMDSVLSVKEEVFASVIIVLFINFFNRATEYNKSNKETFWLYTMIRDAFDELYNPYLGRMIGHYMPFYSLYTYDQFFEIVQNNNVPISRNRIIALSELITKKLNVLEIYNNRERINGCSQEMLQFDIDNCERCIYGLKYDDEQFVKQYMKELFYEAFSLIEKTRSIWIRERSIYVDICKHLINEGYSFLDDFYARMHLYTIGEIDEYEETIGSYKDMTKEDCVNAMALMGIEISDDFDLFRAQVECNNKKRRKRML